MKHRRLTCVLWVVPCLLLPAPALGTPPGAHTHRLAVALVVGAGSARLSGFNAGSRAFVDTIEAVNPQLHVDQSPRATWQANGLISLRYYSPVYLLAEIALGVIESHGSTRLLAGPLQGDLGFRNWVIELPILIGAYLPISHGLQIHAAAGPTIVLGARSNWDYSLGPIANLEAHRGGGYHGLIGVDLALWGPLRLGLEARYRYVTTADLDGSRAYPPVQPLGSMDLSGFSAAAVIRAFVWSL